MTTDVKELMKDFQRNQIKQLNHEIIIKEGYAKTWQEEFEKQVSTLKTIQDTLGDKFNKDLLSEKGLERLRNDLKELYKYEDEYSN